MKAPAIAFIAARPLRGGRARQRPAGAYRGRARSRAPLARAAAASALAALSLGAASPPAGAATWPFDALPAGTVATQRGDLDVLVGDLAELMPQKDSGRYRHPRAAEALRLKRGVALADRGALSNAARRLAPLGYRVVRYHDQATGRPLVVLAQHSARWKEREAWGVYVLDRAGAKLMVQAPHIRADLHSERVAVSVFRRARARALLIAGAHRNAIRSDTGPALADVAHQRASAFHAVHVALRSRGLKTVVQAHGFGADQPDAIVSSGKRKASTAARRVHARLLDAGFASCRYHSAACPRLGGITNEQGKDTRQAGGEFVHVELAQPLRIDAPARAKAARAIAAGLTAAFARRSRQSRSRPSRATAPLGGPRAAPRRLGRHGQAGFSAGLDSHCVSYAPLTPTESRATRKGAAVTQLLASARHVAPRPASRPWPFTGGD